MLRRGFTLIELLVVITILAILAGAALPYVQSYVAESRIAKAKTDLEEIARALAVYETREGEYTKANVSDLTGRYLNKAPIDPWGKPYKIATASGLVISGGPDRNDGESGSVAADNISAPYQPPLALVQVKWLDRNQSGAVDTQNTPDQVQLYFSRKIMHEDDADALGDTASMAVDLNALFTLSSGASMTQQFVLGSSTVLSSKQVVVLTVNSIATSPFVPGSDTITLNTGNTGKFVYDLAGNKSLSGQAVVVLPQ